MYSYLIDKSKPLGTERGFILVWLLVKNDYVNMQYPPEVLNWQDIF